MFYLGVDPGKEGAWCFLDEKGAITDWGMNADMDRAIDFISDSGQDVAICLELVHSMKKQGVVSAFSFGKEVGIWEGIIKVLRVPNIQAAPQKWQKAVLDFLPEKEKKKGEESEKQCNARRAGNRKQIKCAVLDFVRRQYPKQECLFGTVIPAKQKEALADAICLARYARLKSLVGTK